ncbi:hypothetical protein PENFLA_c001G07375 [Penicillium flavigenum]|uniref:Uncharacterized protein n=1 Tax=Penicillium flavigenum TaxID=254877 RepID=A0A1V6U3W3_9EURO|nr:hypothetical protein PENFLA_c091G03738 [Penicillium flavigenum]OQE32799.1 hypothetical protein PENFLA_c001G07375 [Penicillium flavigenum]
MPSQLEDADQVLNTFQDNPPLDDNLPRPCEDLTSLSSDTGSQNIHEEALNEFQFGARRDENLARPFEDLDDEALNELFESLNNKNLGCPSKDHFSQPLAKDTGPQNVDEALSARPFEFTFSQPPSWDMGSHDIDHEALNEFQFEALRDENLARPFEDLDAEALNELFESLNNKNHGCPSKDHFSQPLAKDTGPQNVDEEALNARPSELTVSQPPWDMGSQDFDQASSSFQHTSPTNNKLAHHSTRQVSDDESRYMSEGSNDSRFVTPANTSHTQPTDHHFSRYTGFDANETLSNLQNEICAN